MKYCFRKFCLVFLLLVLYSLQIYSQVSQKEIIPAGLEMKITLQSDNMKFGDVLKSIINKTGVKINYSYSSIPVDKEISCHYNEESAYEILKELCKKTNTVMTVSTRFTGDYY